MENKIRRLDIILSTLVEFLKSQERKLDFLLNFERGSVMYIEILDTKHLELNNLHCS